MSRVRTVGLSPISSNLFSSEKYVFYCTIPRSDAAPVQEPIINVCYCRLRAFFGTELVSGKNSRHIWENTKRYLATTQIRCGRCLQTISGESHGFSCTFSLRSTQNRVFSKFTTPLSIFSVNLKMGAALRVLSDLHLACCSLFPPQFLLGQYSSPLSEEWQSMFLVCTRSHTRVLALPGFHLLQ